MATAAVTAAAAVATFIARIIFRAETFFLYSLTAACVLHIAVHSMERRTRIHIYMNSCRHEHNLLAKVISYSYRVVVYTHFRVLFFGCFAVAFLWPLILLCVELVLVRVDLISAFHTHTQTPLRNQLARNATDGSQQYIRAFYYINITTRCRQ